MTNLSTHIPIKDLITELNKIVEEHGDDVIIALDSDRDIGQGYQYQGLSVSAYKHWRKVSTLLAATASYDEDSIMIEEPYD